MAENNFGFELRADDQASAVLQQINDQVRALQPELVRVREGLSLGGQETQEGLTAFSSAFQNLSRLAKDNVQFFGDMVPPLKMVSGFAGRIGSITGKLGLAGGAAYLAGKGIKSMVTNMDEASDSAYGLETAARNAGLSVHDFSQMSGAMRLLGTDSSAAQSSVENLYKTFNDALQGRNSNVLAIMAQLHAPIARNTDGTANVLETMKELAAVFPTLSSNNQKTVADALGLDENALQLLREGVRLKSLLAKSDSVGLTADPQVISQLSEFNRATTEAGAAWDGLKQRVSQGLYGFMLSDGSIKDMVKGTTDVMEHGPDNIALMHMAGFNRANEADEMRRGYTDPEFMNSLSLSDKVMLDFGLMSDGYREKYQRYFGLKDKVSLFQQDMNAAMNVLPDENVKAHGGRLNSQARSVRNNNPWNLRYADQRGATRAGDNFAAFSTPEEGLLAADRQLQLYASGKSRAAKGKPLTTLRNIISVASPKSENDTTQMIRDASRELQISPDSQLNLADPGERSRVLHALFEREGNNPWSTAQIQQLITNTGAPLESQMANQTAPQPLSGNGSGPSPVTPLITPPQPASPVQTQELTETLATALKDNGIKVELTLINNKTGDRKTFSGSGGKIATAMTFP